MFPWALLVAGSAASLAANVAVAEPTFAGRVIAAWPPFALIGAYELLMHQIRHAAAAQESEAEAAMPVAGAAQDAIPESGVQEEAAPEETAVAAPTAGGTAAAAGRQRQWQSTRGGGAPATRGVAMGARQPIAGWQSPSGTTIACRFGKSDRWGRLVTQAGKTGRLSSLAAVADSEF